MSQQATTFVGRSTPAGTNVGGGWTTTGTKSTTSTSGTSTTSTGTKSTTTSGGSHTTTGVSYQSNANLTDSGLDTQSQLNIQKAIQTGDYSMLTQREQGFVSLVKNEMVTDVKSGFTLIPSQGVINIDGGLTGGGVSVRTQFRPNSSGSALGSLTGGVQAAQDLIANNQKQNPYYISFGQGQLGLEPTYTKSGGMRAYFIGGVPVQTGMFISEPFANKLTQSITQLNQEAKAENEKNKKSTTTATEGFVLPSLSNPPPSEPTARTLFGYGFSPLVSLANEIDVLNAKIQVPLTPMSYFTGQTQALFGLKAGMNLISGGLTFPSRVTYFSELSAPEKISTGVELGSYTLAGIGGFLPTIQSEARVTTQTLFPKLTSEIVKGGHPFIQNILGLPAKSGLFEFTKDLTKISIGTIGTIGVTSAGVEIAQSEKPVDMAAKFIGDFARIGLVSNEIYSATRTYSLSLEPNIKINPTPTTIGTQFLKKGDVTISKSDFLTIGKETGQHPISGETFFATREGGGTSIMTTQKSVVKMNLEASDLYTKGVVFGGKEFVLGELPVETNTFLIPKSVKIEGGKVNYELIQKSMSQIGTNKFIYTKMGIELTASEKVVSEMSKQVMKGGEWFDVTREIIKPSAISDVTFSQGSKVLNKGSAWASLKNPSYVREVFEPYTTISTEGTSIRTTMTKRDVSIGQEITDLESFSGKFSKPDFVSMIDFSDLSSAKITELPQIKFEEKFGIVESPVKGFTPEGGSSQGTIGGGSSGSLSRFAQQFEKISVTQMTKNIFSGLTKLPVIEPPEYISPVKPIATLFPTGTLVGTKTGITIEKIRITPQKTPIGTDLSNLHISKIEQGTKTGQRNRSTTSQLQKTGLSSLSITSQGQITETGQSQTTEQIIPIFMIPIIPPITPPEKPPQTPPLAFPKLDFKTDFKRKKSRRRFGFKLPKTSVIAVPRADLLSRDISIMRFGKATNPKSTKISRRNYMKAIASGQQIFPTVEMMKARKKGKNELF